MIQIVENHSKLKNSSEVKNNSKTEKYQNSIQILQIT